MATKKSATKKSVTKSAPKKNQWGIQITISGGKPDDATLDAVQGWTRKLAPELVETIAKAHKLTVTRTRSIVKRENPPFSS